MAWRFLIVSGAFLLAGLILLNLVRTSGGRSAGRLPVLRQVGTFGVTNQAGLPVSDASLRGRPWAINLIFTRCPGPCLQLSGIMRKVQGALAPDARAGLLSITSDPEYDTPSVLAAYAAKVGADTNRWQFVTGATPDIRRLAVSDLLLVLVDKPEDQRSSPEDLFLHSTLIVVVDAQGRLRTAIEALLPGAAERVVDALRQLESER